MFVREVSCIVEFWCKEGVGGGEGLIIFCYGVVLRVLRECFVYRVSAFVRVKFLTYLKYFKYVLYLFIKRVQNST